MPLVKFRKGDSVKVLTGKDRGKTGKVLEVSHKNNRVLVEGVNLVTRHRRPRRMNEKGQKITKPSFIHPSNLMLMCSNCGKPTRVGANVAENGEKSRVCKKCKRTV